ncbi:hypothetical protein NDU88_001947 [Pleurodeles waltl]|uniref:Uncharacterized protein n=1 Tax=Pleurodeles waltl TaxID=8319 RepID=A0AAV7WP92_PLEWA|nr:hypothetical protein NDU88_001947 [Pleurodeles waltl]
MVGSGILGTHFWRLPEQNRSRRTHDPVGPRVPGVFGAVGGLERCAPPKEYEKLHPRPAREVGRPCTWGEAHRQWRRLLDWARGERSDSWIDSGAGLCSERHALLLSLLDLDVAGLETAASLVERAPGGFR